MKEGFKWVGAVYFPRGQQSFNAIKTKFQADFDGVIKNQADAFVFVTNQELSVSERKELMTLHLDYRIEVHHLERIVNILNTPSNYGVRLEFLDIEITPEEQLAYFAERDKTFLAMMEKFDKFTEARMMRHDDEECEGRTVEEISGANTELLDKIWYDRHLSLKYRVRTGQETVDPEIWKGALKSARAVVRRYGRENLGPWTDFEWGMLNGKLSALRWVLGDDWDMLDT
ncbi:hypothetical protein [Alicyclobacillus acidiphilus]|uniref:hypothetical protein n=1 Tax=Alicyclobacillus acidiphilus TaxID=182455 RepID=UPI000833E1C5|nr:hypothetical protein [Alicyclobacillus acidiphilus]